MMYKHKYFILDTGERKVFDENGKELRLTGNAYRMLVFLCQNQNGNVTDIGNYLDSAKDYDENHLRQYRYKINTIIGHDVVEYKNGLYSFSGEVKKAAKLESNHRNTGLLHSNSSKLKKEVPFLKWPAVLSSILLLLSFIGWPYGYYTLLRIVVTATAVYYAYYLYSKPTSKFWFWSLIIIALIFNPVFPIYLYEKGVWFVVDVITAVFLITLIIKKDKYVGVTTN